MSDLQQPVKKEGSCEIINLTLTTPKKQIDIRNIAVAANIYESMLTPSAILELTIDDRLGLYNHFNFTEQEVNVEFTTYEKASPIKYKFKIIQVKPAKPIYNSRGIIYIMTGITEEAFKSRNTQDFPFMRKNFEASDTVINIMQRYLQSTKPLFVEKTKGLHTFGKSKISPFDAIDDIRKQAISSQFQGSAFCFFENNRGFHFKSIEKLIEEGKKNIGDKYFILTNAANVDKSGSVWRNILAYKTIQTGSQNVYLATGGGRARVQSIDLETFQIRELNKTILDYNFNRMNEGAWAMSTKADLENSKDTSKVFQVLVSPDQESNLLLEKRAAEACFISQFLSVINQITIYGDSTLTVGDMIHCDIKEQSEITPGDKNPYTEDNKILSGNFLVTKVRHALSFGDLPQYFQGLEIVKDSVGSSLQPIAVGI